jgi:hypothetical protein
LVGKSHYVEPYLDERCARRDESNGLRGVLAQRRLGIVRTSALWPYHSVHPRVAAIVTDNDHGTLEILRHGQRRHRARNGTDLLGAAWTTAYVAPYHSGSGVPGVCMYL